MNKQKARSSKGGVLERSRKQKKTVSELSYSGGRCANYTPIIGIRLLLWCQEQREWIDEGE